MRRTLWMIACGLLLATGIAAAQTESPEQPPTGDAAPDVAPDAALRESLAELEQRNAALQEQLDAALASGDDRSAQLRALQEDIVRQRDEIAEQLAELENQRQSLAAQEERIAALEDMVVSLNNRLLELQDQLPDSTLTAAMAERLERLESSAEEMPELPTTVVGAGDFPGSLRIPGTDAQIKIGGLVKASLVYNLDALATDDRFFTAGIPIKGTAEAGKGPRLTLSARSSRFNLDMRTPTGVGHVRAFIEGDFAGDENVLRLRHAYGQYNKFLFGQTWSNLADFVAVPEQIDFEGLNAQITLRKSQLRGVFELKKHEFSVSIENAAPDITGADGISLVPDVIVGTVWNVPWRHLRTTLVGRVLRAEAEDDPGESYSHAAWGLAVSGRIDVKKDAEHNFKFALNFGQGIGHYINDLGAVGGQDAVLDTEQDELRTLPVLAGYVAYAHWWKSERWRSTACFGYVWVDNLDIQADDSYYETLRFSFNLIYTPAPRMDVGLEVLTGRRTNKDRQYGTATQIQLAWYFRF